MTGYTDYNELFRRAVIIASDARSAGGDVAYFFEMLATEMELPRHDRPTILSIAENIEMMVDEEFSPELMNTRELFYPTVNDYFYAGNVLLDGYNYLIEGLQLGVFFGVIDSDHGQEIFSRRRVLFELGFKVYDPSTSVHSTTAELYESIERHYNNLVDIARP